MPRDAEHARAARAQALHDRLTGPLAATGDERVLRQLERDGLVWRTVHPEVPPRVEYGLTEWGQSLCPVLDGLIRWRLRQADGSAVDLVAQE